MLLSSLTGCLSGSLSGSLTGSLTGCLSGSLTGSLTGSLSARFAGAKRTPGFRMAENILEFIRIRPGRPTRPALQHRSRCGLPTERLKLVFA